MALTLPTFLGPARELPKAPVLSVFWESIAGSEASNDIGFSMLGQEAFNWCWSAVTQSVIFHLLNPRLDSQADIATNHIRHSRPTSPCLADQGDVAGGKCDTVCSRPCNGFHKVRIVLEEIPFTVRPLAVDGAVAFEVIQREIAARSPVVCRIDFGEGTGHFLCVTGWRVRNGQRDVLVHDPRSGPGGRQVPEKYMLYSDFADHYVLQGAVGRNNYAYSVRLPA